MRQDTKYIMPCRRVGIGKTFGKKFQTRKCQSGVSCECLFSRPVDEAMSEPAVKAFAGALILGGAIGYMKVRTLPCFPTNSACLFDPNIHIPYTYCIIICHITYIYPRSKSWRSFKAKSIPLSLAERQRNLPRSRRHRWQCVFVGSSRSGI